MKTYKRMMILFSLSGLFFLSCAREMPPRKVSTLHEVTDPSNRMWTTKGRLFVTNSTDPLQMRTTILVYSLEDYRLEKQFGGPGMFKIQPAHSVFLFLLPDKFAVNSSEKVSIYNYEFELLQELAHGGDSFFYVPFGNKFVARHVYAKNKTNYYWLNLYDSELNIIKELCSKEFVGRAFSGDYSFDVYEGKLYVAKRRDDFFIEVFDEEGNRINSFTYDCPRVKVTQEHKDLYLSSLTNRPGWERYFKSREDMEEYYRNLIKYPEYFPAIADILFADEKIYVVTGNQVEDKREIWILDMGGKIIDKKTVHFKMRSETVWFPYSIQNKHLYQLILNEQTEKWELYSIKIM